MCDREGRLPRVVLTCLGRFYAFDLARQLLRHGMLQKIITVYPKRYVARWGIPEDKIVSLHFIGALMYLRRKIPGRSGRVVNEFLLWFYDFVAAYKLGRDYDIAIGWSSCCLRILRAAQKRGAIGIVERASTHIEEQKRLLLEERQITKNPNQPIPSERVIRRELAEYAQADYIMSPSQFTKKTFLQRGFPASKLLSNPFGVDLTDFSPRTTCCEHPFTIIHCGLLSIRKGVHYLLKAFAELDLPDARLKLIGAVKDEIRPFLARYQHPRIQIAGVFPLKELAQQYSDGSVFCLCSIEEGMAMVVPQAMACGLPVIVTENTGTSDIVADGKNGFVIPIRDVETLKQKIRFLYENPEICREMGRNALASAKQALSWDDYGDRAAAIYQKCFQEHQG